MIPLRAAPAFVRMRVRVVVFVVGLTSLAAGACEPRVTSLGSFTEPVRTTGRYLEAEAGELSSGFAIQDDDAASGGRAIAPPDGVTSDDAPGEARASYRITVERAGSYVIWGRIRSPDAMHNRAWFQVDGDEFRKWRISTGDIWYWDALHEDRDYGHALKFEWSAGEHQLVFANCIDGIGLDRLYVTADGDTPPGNDTPCNPPHSIEVGGECLPSCGLLGGTNCGESCAGKEPLSAYDCDVCCRIEP